MALIKCPECGGDVSDQAPACIHCGFPLEEYVAQLNDGSQRYDLYATNISIVTDEEKEIEGRLFKELLGMDSSDYYHVKNKTRQMVAQNLTVEQLSKVVGPLIANGLRIIVSVFEHDGERNYITYSEVDGYSSEYEVKQDHYEQVINEAQKVEIEQPRATSYAAASSASSASAGPKCPTCGSMNVQKINQAGRLVSTAVWGVSSKKMAKTYKCNKCGHTW